MPNAYVNILTVMSLLPCLYVNEATEKSFFIWVYSVFKGRQTVTSPIETVLFLCVFSSSSSSMKSVDSSLEHFTDIYWYFHKVTGNAKKHMMPYIQG